MPYFRQLLPLATVVLLSAIFQGSAKAQTWDDLNGNAYIVGGDRAFLGVVSSDQSDPDSICNDYGDFGSRYSDLSIWNAYGDYGSRYSDFGAFNARAENPPALVLDGVVLLFVRVGGYRDSIDPRELYQIFCE